MTLAVRQELSIFIRIGRKRQSFIKVLAVVTGVPTGLIGLYAMFAPFQTFLGIGWVLGILLLVNGIETVIETFKGGEKDIWKSSPGAEHQKRKIKSLTLQKDMVE